MTEEEPTTQPEPENAPAEVEDIEALKKALAEARAKAEANLAGWQRAQADFINFKRHAEEEKEQTYNQVTASLVKELLPVLDDLERAFASVPPELAEVKWLDGLKLICKKLKALLEAQGLSGIKAVGEKFDPHFHEAVMEVKGKEGVVIEELQKGYNFKDRVIRPSKVAVGNGEKAGKAKEE